MRLDPNLYIDGYRNHLMAFLPQSQLDEFFRRYVYEPLRKERAAQQDIHNRLIAESEDCHDGAYELRKMAFSELARIAILDEFEFIADELAIMSAYKAIETWRGTRLASIATEAEIGRLSDWNFLKTRFAFLRSLCGASEVDELRLINNCIKHSGRVSKTLATNYPGWSSGEPLTNLKAAYRRIAPYLGAYWVDLIQTVAEQAEKNGSETGS